MNLKQQIMIAMSFVCLFDSLYVMSENCGETEALCNHSTCVYRPRVTISIYTLVISFPSSLLRFFFFFLIAHFIFAFVILFLHGTSRLFLHFDRKTFECVRIWYMCVHSGVQRSSIYFRKYVYILLIYSLAKTQ